MQSNFMELWFIMILAGRLPLAGLCYGESHISKSAQADLKNLRC